MRLLAGTAGFSNDDWAGVFYPPGLPRSERLGFYAEHFDAVEINSTFYAVPGRRTFQSMVERAAGRLSLCVKLHRSFTHERDADAAAADRFRYTVGPAGEAGVLGPLLAQFPYSFRNTEDGRAWVGKLARWFSGMELAVEFRHDSWDRPAVDGLLRDLGLHPVSVDLPDLPGLPEPAARGSRELAYLRLAGRNAASWWEANSASARHDYLYAEAELEAWVRRLRRVAAERSYAFFLNTVRGQALENARRFRRLWDAAEDEG